MHERLIDQPSLVTKKLYEVLLLEILVGEIARFALLSDHARNGVSVLFLDVARQSTEAQAIQTKRK